MASVLLLDGKIITRRGGGREEEQGENCERTTKGSTEIYYYIFVIPCYLLEYIIKSKDSINPVSPETIRPY